MWNLETNLKDKEIIDGHSDCIDTFAIYIGEHEYKYLLSGLDDKK